MLSTQYQPQNRIANSLDEIAGYIGSEKVDIGLYPLPLKRIADTVDSIAAKIKEEGGVYTKVPTKILGSDDYDPVTGEPTIENPEENVFYLVPSNNVLSDDMFDEWVYIHGNWERFGSGGGAEVVGYTFSEGDVDGAFNVTSSTGGTQNVKIHGIRSFCLGDDDDDEEIIFDGGTATDMLSGNG